ncbi:MAG: hypothetical protein JSS12_04145 [Verrucomicrobia bacterium]|nr:hypothetical protein [Verrucomicrobiota bacterium]
MSASQLAKYFWSIQILDVADKHSIINDLTPKLIERLPDFTPTDCALSAYAVSRDRIHCRDLFAHLTVRVLSTIERFEPSDLTLFATSYAIICNSDRAVLECRDMSVVSALSKQAHATMNSFTGNELHTFLTALFLLMIVDRELVTAIKMRASTIWDTLNPLTQQAIRLELQNHERFLLS